MPILYKQDFLRYPGSIVDTQSKNKSWVEFAGKLHLMGVKNWHFPLALINSELQGVDPHDPELDKHTRLLILEECEINHWYFFREVLRIKTTSGEPGYLEANRGNIAAYWCVFNSFVVMLEQIRQTGKSLFGRTMASWFHNVGVENAQHILFTKGDLRSDEIKEYKLMRDMLPPWMYVKHPKEKDNQMEYTTMARGNYTFTYVPQGDPTAANGVGRGKTPRMIQCDEPPFCPYSEISIPALIGSTTRTFDDCKNDGMFHAMFFTTTAGDLSTKEGKYVFEEIRSKCMFFSEALYDCVDVEDAKRLIFASSKNQYTPYVLIAFNHLQLGKTNQWLKETISRTPAKPDQIKRDFLGIWTFGSTTNPIGERLLSKIRSHICYTPLEVREGDYIIRYYGDVETIRNTPVAMGLDCSEAIGRDSITGVGISIESTDTLIAFGVNDTNLSNFSYWLSQYLKNFPMITLVPEAKNSWAGIRDRMMIDMPLMGLDIGRRVYSRIVDNARGSEQDEREYREYCSGQPSERKYHEWRNLFGFPTNETLRKVLFDNILKSATNENPTGILDLPLIDEMSALVNRKNRVEHPVGGHDDYVIAFLLAHWFVRFGRNLKHYGIDQGLIMRRIMKVELATPHEIRKREKEDQKRNELDRLRNRLNEANGLMEVRYLEAKIRSLENDVTQEPVTDARINSLDRASHDATNRRIKMRPRRLGRF